MVQTFLGFRREAGNKLRDLPVPLRRIGKRRGSFQPPGQQIVFFDFGVHGTERHTEEGGRPTDISAVVFQRLDQQFAFKGILAPGDPLRKRFPFPGNGKRRNGNYAPGLSASDDFFMFRTPS